MNTTVHVSTAKRIGHRVVRGWRAYVRGERRVSNWVVSKGVPKSGATTLLWVIKLVVLWLLIYAVFWPALLFLVSIAVTGVANNTAVQDDRWAQGDELRNGEAGFGLYSSNGQRIDPHDPNDPFNE